MTAVNRRFLLEGFFFIYLWELFNVNDDGKDKEPIDFGFERSSRRSVEFRDFAVGNAVHSGILLESGFHMIAVIATIAEIELNSISTIATIAVIAGEWFPYDRYDR